MSLLFCQRAKRANTHTAKWLLPWRGRQGHRAAAHRPRFAQPWGRGLVGLVPCSHHLPSLALPLLPSFPSAPLRSLPSRVHSGAVGSGSQGDRGTSWGGGRAKGKPCMCQCQSGHAWLGKTRFSPHTKHSQMSDHPLLPCCDRALCPCKCSSPALAPCCREQGGRAELQAPAWVPSGPGGRDC